MGKSYAEIEDQPPEPPKKPWWKRVWQKLKPFGITRDEEGRWMITFKKDF